MKQANICPHSIHSYFSTSFKKIQVQHHKNSKINKNNFFILERTKLIYNGFISPNSTNLFALTRQQDSSRMRLTAAASSTVSKAEESCKYVLLGHSSTLSHRSVTSPPRLPVSTRMLTIGNSLSIKLATANRCLLTMVSSDGRNNVF